MAAAICRTADHSLDLYAVMSAMNPGIARLAKSHGQTDCIKIGDIHDAKLVTGFAKEKNIELAIVSPDAVLAAGVGNALEEAGIPCASPTKEAARIEWDKKFARELMKKHSIPGLPDYGVFDNLEEAGKFIDGLGKDVVIKPAGLTGGKGVKIMGEHLKDAAEAKEYVKEILEHHIGGLPSVLVEERLEGEEFTLQAFVDGEHVVGMPAVQDHKRAYEGDVGPNTGGMGSYSDANHLLPFMNQEDYDAGLGIMKKTVKALKQEGVTYRGVLYGQFMLTKDGPKVIEFNSRFGDPEAMNVLSILESDYLGVLEQIIAGELKQPVFSKKATVCKYIVPEGYPEKPKSNEVVYFNNARIFDLGAKLYFASVDEREEGMLYTGRSRTAGIVGVADTIPEAERIAQEATEYVTGKVFFRKDIGTQPLVQKRVDHMKKIRGG